MRLLVPLLMLAAFINPARASLIQNGSFENVTAGTTMNFQTAGVANWTNSDIGETLAEPSWFTNGYLYLVPLVGLAGPFPATSPDGGNFVLSDGDYHNSPIVQTLTGLTPGATYNLSFYQGLAQDTEAFVTIPGPVTGRWQVSFGASSQLSSQMFGDGSTLTISPWALETMTFTAQNASEILSFLSIGTGDPPLVALDGINLVESPEAANGWLTGLGVLMLGWMLVARRKTA